MTLDKELEIVFPAQMESLSEVENLIDSLHAEGALPEEVYGNILIASTEATLNAIMHGSLSDSSKTISVRLTQDAREVVITIADEGDGFDFESLPDPTAPENLEKVSGRGIYIMRNLADKTEFEHQGSSVKMTFNLPN